MVITVWPQQVASPNFLIKSTNLLASFHPTVLLHHEFQLPIVAPLLSSLCCRKLIILPTDLSVTFSLAHFLLNTSPQHNSSSRQKPASIRSPIKSTAKTPLSNPRTTHRAVYVDTKRHHVLSNLLGGERGRFGLIRLFLKHVV